MNSSPTILPLLTTVLAAILSAGCASPHNARPAQMRADVRVLIDTDEEFARTAQRIGTAEAFRDFAAESATMFPMGGSPVHGRSAIFELVKSGLRGELLWTPSGGDIAATGDLGYTWGIYVFRGPGPDGKDTTRHGKYVTIWKRQRDGSWKFVVDIGNPGPPPET